MVYMFIHRMYILYVFYIWSVCSAIYGSQNVEVDNRMISSSEAKNVCGSIPYRILAPVDILKKTQNMQILESGEIYWIDGESYKICGSNITEEMKGSCEEAFIESIKEYNNEGSERSSALSYICDDGFGNPKVKTPCSSPYSITNLNNMSILINLPAFHEGRRYVICDFTVKNAKQTCRAVEYTNNILSVKLLPCTEKHKFVCLSVSMSDVYLRTLRYKTSGDLMGIEYTLKPDIKGTSGGNIRIPHTDDKTGGQSTSSVSAPFAGIAVAVVLILIFIALSIVVVTVCFVVRREKLAYDDHEPVLKYVGHINDDCPEDNSIPDVPADYVRSGNQIAMETDQGAVVENDHLRTSAENNTIEEIHANSENFTSYSSELEKTVDIAVEHYSTKI